jgi:hypothetical protein
MRREADSANYNLYKEPKAKNLNPKTIAQDATGHNTSRKTIVFISETIAV